MADTWIEKILKVMVVWLYGYVLLIVLLNIEWLRIEKKVVLNWICCVNEVCSVC